MSLSTQIKLGIAGVLGLVALILFMVLWPFTSIDTGERGIVLNFRAFNGEIMEPGFHYVTPIMQDVVKINVQTQKVTGEKLVYSQDSQEIKITWALNYNLDPKSVGTIYQNLGVGYENKVIAPKVPQIIEEVIGKTNAEKLVTNREVPGATIRDQLAEALSTYSIVVTDFVMEDVEFDQAYEDAIKAKQVAEQNAKKAENDTRTVEQESKQAILRAEAEAKKAELQAKALTLGGDKVIEQIYAEAALEAAKKWNGQLPTTMPPNSTVPYINLTPQR
jgi:regulator of protease activity HflC (stomatin/prohibitin superfamily)